MIKISSENFSNYKSAESVENNEAILFVSCEVIIDFRFETPFLEKFNVHS